MKRKSETDTSTSLRTSSRKKQRPSFYHEEVQSKDNSGSSVKEKREISKIIIFEERQPIPQRNTSTSTIVFPDHPEFRPNLTPKEVIQLGSFGGTYFRVIKSGVTGQTYTDAWKEFPQDWFENLTISRAVSSRAYDVNVNSYKVSCGGDLKMWEESGWITEADPYGWFQWYCRFYLGRRCSDDDRQISRALGVMGPNGRWRKNLINKCLRTGKKPEEVIQDNTIAPKIRQLLQVS